MADYSREIVQALREVAQELRLMRNAIEGIDRRLATSGGLTAALTRRAHLIISGKRVICSACGATCGEWLGDAETTLACYGERCTHCKAVFGEEVSES